MENANKYNPIRGVLLQKKSRLAVDDLVSQLVGTKGTDKMFVRCFCLLVIGTVLFPTSATFVNQLFIHMVSAVSSISEKNQASSCFGVLVDSIQRFKSMSNKYIPGCTLFLEVCIHGQ